MVLERWDPMRELRRMDETMNRLWRGVHPWEEMEGWAVPLDVIQDANSVTVKASIPGVKPEDIHVTIEEGMLTIKGETKAEREERGERYLMRERRAGSFHRALRLPDTVDADKAESHYENGVLTISFPKVEAKKAKRLEVKVR